MNIVRDKARLRQYGFSANSCGRLLYHIKDVWEAMPQPSVSVVSDDGNNISDCATAVCHHDDAQLQETRTQDDPSLSLRSPLSKVASDSSPQGGLAASDIVPYDSGVSSGAGTPCSPTSRAVLCSQEPTAASSQSHSQATQRRQLQPNSRYLPTRPEPPATRSMRRRSATTSTVGTVVGPCRPPHELPDTATNNSPTQQRKRKLRVWDWSGRLMAAIVHGVPKFVRHGTNLKYKVIFCMLYAVHACIGSNGTFFCLVPGGCTPPWQVPRQK